MIGKKMKVAFENRNAAKRVISQAVETKEQNLKLRMFAKPNGVFYSEHSWRNEIIDQCVFDGWLI
jgi:hypothetical protein